MKRIFSVILIIAILAVGQLCAFASPETLDSDVEGTTSDLIIVTKPENQKDSTFSTTYIISGYGMGGTVVTLYSYNANDDVYEKVYNKTQYIDEAGGSQLLQNSAEVTIGSSGLFMGSVDLATGENVILLRDENGDHVQYIKLSLTKFSYNIIDLIRALTV